MKEEEAAGLESTLALLWAPANGLLREISLEGVEVPHEFLTSFAIPDNVKSVGHITANITADNVSNGFQKWTETTSMSPSGRHLGHYK